MSDNQKAITGPIPRFTIWEDGSCSGPQSTGDWCLYADHKRIINALRDEFPLFDDEGLDQEKHHCEWSMQYDRKRLHKLLDDLEYNQ